jgi:hypothetical protein
MSSHRTRRLDRHRAEELLRGGPVAQHEAARLAALLRAAGAPAHAEELSGERAALAAFREAAHLDPVPRSRRPSMLKTFLAKVLTVKAAVAVAGVAVSGVALAASAEVLPNPLAKRPATPASHAPAAPSTTGSDRAAGPNERSQGPKKTPSPSLAGLCKAYAAHPTAGRGKALESRAFTVLVTAAGGADKVDDYCATLADAPADKATKPDARPTDPGRAPTDRPGHGGKPASPPAGPPTDVPGGSDGSSLDR